MSNSWHPASWRSKPAEQLPVYADAAALADVERKLAGSAPIVLTDESERLRERLAEAAAGRALLLQGGDCAEVFGGHDAESVAALSGLFDRMVAILARQAGVPVVRVARIAGQYAKPRTTAVEQRDGLSLPVWRGEIVNRKTFDAKAREADPARMLHAHADAARTRALLPPNLFTSHEALLLPYEEALVRRGADGRHWSGSGHLLWIGDRTRAANGAHAEFLRGIANPVAVKIGPSVEPDELLRLADLIDPQREPGRLTLIVRQGVDAIASRLPPLLRAMSSAGRQPLWISDPMHGNMVRGGPFKLRRFEVMLEEAGCFTAIAQAEGVWPGGLHLEMTADDVAECLGGSGPAGEAELGPGWRSACDPRLNASQALDFARSWAETLNRRAAA